MTSHLHFLSFLVTLLVLLHSPFTIEARRNCSQTYNQGRTQTCCRIGPDGGSCRFLHHALEILPGALTTQSDVCLYLATADPDYVFEQFTQVVPINFDQYGNITRDLVLVRQEDENYPAIGFNIYPQPARGAFSRCLIRLVLFPNDGDDARLIARNVFMDGSKTSNRHQYTLAEKERVHMCYASTAVSSSSTSRKRSLWSSITKTVTNIGDDIEDSLTSGLLCVDSLKITCSVAFTFLLGEEEAAMTVASTVAKATLLTALGNTISAAICDLDSSMTSYECSELATLIVSFFTGGLMSTFISEMCYGLGYCICDLAEGDLSDCEAYVNQLDLAQYVK